MISYRVWELRIGRFNIKEVAGREFKFTHANIEHINNKFLDFIRHLAHLIIILLVRGVIEVLFLIRRWANRLSNKLDHFFLENNSIAENPSVSFFLRDIADYKEKLKDMVPNKKDKELGS